MKPKWMVAALTLYLVPDLSLKHLVKPHVNSAKLDKVIFIEFFALPF